MATAGVVDQQWYRCKGCGGECVVFVDPSDGRRKIGHGKPVRLVSVPNSVECALYRRCETFEFFFRELAGERIASPDKFQPVTS